MFTSSVLAVSVNTFNFNSTVSSPTLNQDIVSTNGATGQTLFIQAQNATGTTSTGGELILTSGTGTSIAGNVIISTGGVQKIAITPSVFALSVGTLDFNTSVVNPAINQDDVTTSSAVGQTFVIQAQNATGTTSTGGELLLTSGTGTSIAGNVVISTGGVQKIAVTPTTFSVSNSTIQFESAVSTPIIKQAITSSGSGQSLFLQAQATTAASQTGGTLILDSGQGLGAGGINGNVDIRVGGANYLIFSPNNITVQSGVTLTTTSTGNINLPNNGSARFNIEGSAVGSTVTASNLNTLTNTSNADSLHTHANVSETGLTTTGLADGDFGYVSSANTISKTDATSMTSSRSIGANEGTSGSMTINGIIENAKFTTAGGSPSVGSPVYLAPSTEEAGASGKLTATKPTTAGQVVAEIGLVVNNSNYASLKTSKILLQIKSPIQL